MATEYVEPGVEVTEEFENAGPALALFSLDNVIVGPAYQVVADDSVGNYTGSAISVPYASQVAGSVIDLTDNTLDLLNYPVRVYLENALVQTQAAVTTGSVLVASLNQFVDATSDIFANVLASDIIVVTGSLNGNNGSYTVVQNLGSGVLQVAQTFAATETGLSYTVQRQLVTSTSGTYTFTVQGQAPNLPVEITDFTGVTPFAANVALPVGLALTVSPYGSPCLVKSAQVYLQYRALRFEQSSDLFNYTTLTALQAAFGLDQIVPQNPVVFAANLALAQGAPSVNILELTAEFFSDEVLAYGIAFDTLALNDIYAISVLTQNTTVHENLKAHCDAMSLPANKLERVGICNCALITQVEVADYSALHASINSAGLVVTLPGGTFITDGVVPGYLVTISAPSGAIGQYAIAAVASQTQLTLATAVPGAPFSSNVVMVVDRNLSLDEQASTLAAYAQSLGDRRLVLTWPDVVMLPSGNAIVPVPGYFLNAAVGGLTTLLPTQQGLTNYTVSDYSQVVHSTKYFTNAQMNTLAGGGFMIFVQDVLGVSALKIRHQLTTDLSSIYFQEYSITKNVDFIAKFLRLNHAAFIGQYNIVDTTFDDLRTMAQRSITFLRDTTRLPKIGGVITSGTLSQIIQDPVNIDTIDEIFSLSVPIPLNHLNITLAIS